MDIQRPSSKGKRWLKRGLIVTCTLAGAIGVTVALSRLEPASPVVEKGTVWMDTVKRGDMLREVSGPGSLVPVDIRWIAPSTAGRVERILVRPGTGVTRDTVILELSNEELELQAEDAQLKIQSAELQYEAKKVELDNVLLDLQTSAARVDADLAEAQLRARSDEELAKDGLISALQLQVSKVRSEELAKLKEIEKKRLDVQRQYAKTQLDVLQAQVRQATALYELRKKQVDLLRVRAGFEGVLEQMLVEEGQQVTTSTNLAKVSDPRRLKAVARIDQNQAREVQLGQKARIDLRSAILSSHVVRIDPAVQEGTVNVDLEIDDPLPPGARPDLRLDGYIEIEKLANILIIGRPAFGQPGAVLSLFKLSGNGQEATRTPVKLGRFSVNKVEVLEGLREGDRVILSDMNEYAKNDRVRLR